MSVQRQSFGSAATPLVSVLTPTIPGREPLLRELRAAVAGQTLQHHEHLTLLDRDGAGCSRTMNELAGSARGGWLFPIADDDLMLPGCLEAHLAGLPADVVYSPPLVAGEDAAQFHGSPPNIPAVALIRAELWRTVGGYDERLGATEDLDFFRRAQARGAVFRRVPGPTWVYRFHGGNKSRLPGEPKEGAITDPGTTLG